MRMTSRLSQTPRTKLSLLPRHPPKKYAAKERDSQLQAPIMPWKQRKQFKNKKRKTTKRTEKWRAAKTHTHFMSAAVFCGDFFFASVVSVVFALTPSDLYSHLKLYQTQSLTLNFAMSVTLPANAFQLPSERTRKSTSAFLAPACPRT